MKAHFASTTLVDLFPQMLEVSKHFNPDCEHLVGDMRTFRLGRTFDAVFIHDAIDYMTTLDELRQALETAYLYCKSGGVALFVPDGVLENFEDSTDHGGSDGEGRGARYLEWSYDPTPEDTTYIAEYILVLRQDNHPTQVEHDQHLLGIFPSEDWLRLLREAGFIASVVIDDYERYVFVGRKP